MPAGKPGSPRDGRWLSASRFIAHTLKELQEESLRALDFARDRPGFWGSGQRSQSHGRALPNPLPSCLNIAARRKSPHAPYYSRPASSRRASPRPSRCRLSAPTGCRRSSMAATARWCNAPALASTCSPATVTTGWCGRHDLRRADWLRHVDSPAERKM